MRRKPATILFSSTHNLKKSKAHYFSWRRSLPVFFYFFSGLFLILALTGPKKGVGLIQERSEGIDIILALDVSGSMKSMDIPSKMNSVDEINRALQSGDLKERMDVAKSGLEKFVDARSQDRIGLIAFAGLPFTVCPPTLDHQFLKANLKNLSAGMFSRTAGGTGIASPIAIATNSLKSSTAKRRVMVLFTDGENTVDDIITPIQAADLALNCDITIYTVGIGSNRAIQKGFFGRPEIVNNSFDRQLLQDIAEKTKGIYLGVEDKDSFAEAMEQINKFEKTTIIQPKFTSYKELYPILLVIAIILLAIGFTLEQTYSLRIP